MQELRTDVFTMEIGLVRNKVDRRMQAVTVQLENIEGKPRRIYIQGYCGIYNERISLKEILKLAIAYNYCAVALLDGKDKDGNLFTELVVQSCPQEDFTTTDELDAIIFEVADKTDYIVMKYFEQAATSYDRP